MFGVHVPPLGDRTPSRPNRLLKAIACFFLRLRGWRFDGVIPNEPKVVFIFAPHTTAWDLFWTMVAVFALELRVSWMGADWVFKFPFMKAMGGVPIDRKKSTGVVEQYVDLYQGQDQCLIALSPEGSRKKRVPWRSGFYHIAHGAGVPIGLLSPDYRQRLLILGPHFLPSGDFEADMDAHIRPFYERYLDEYPDRFGM